jgi:hypothetical protein
MIKINFPEVTDSDMAFGGYPEEWFQKMLNEQESPLKYQNLAQTLFFEGGKVPVDNFLDTDYTTKGLRILNAVLRSWGSKHEHKIQVAGVILKAICKDINKK